MLFITSLFHILQQENFKRLKDLNVESKYGKCSLSGQKCKILHHIWSKSLFHKTISQTWMLFIYNIDFHDDCNCSKITDTLLSRKQLDRAKTKKQILKNLKIAEVELCMTVKCSGKWWWCVIYISNNANISKNMWLLQHGHLSNHCPHVGPHHIITTCYPVSMTGMTWCQHVRTTQFLCVSWFFDITHVTNMTLSYWLLVMFSCCTIWHCQQRV